VRIIGLGEGTHNIGSVFQAKVKVAKYFHEELGYDVIAFESGLYDMSKANEALKSDSVKAKDIFSGLFGLWWTQEVKELIDYIIETQKTNKPLMIAGFDNQFSAGKDDLGRFYDDFKSFVDTFNLTTKSRVRVDSSFINALNVEIRYSNSFSKVPERDTLALSHVLNSLINIIDDSKLSENNYWGYWRAICVNIQNDFRKRYCTKCQFRDHNMFENVKWLAENKYKNKKLILWAATIHLAVETSSVDKGDYRYATMGSFLRKQFGDQYYAVAFIPGEGRGGYRNSGLLSYKIKSPTEHSIESVFQKLNTPYGFMSFRSKENVDYISGQKLDRSKIFWKEEIKMNSSKVVDGVFYIKTVNAPNYGID
jgi:erythromycin esterase-like protein